MTSQDFQAVADALVRAQFRMEDTTGNQSLASMCAYDAADSLAREFARQYPNFSREHFFKALGFEESA